MSATAIDADAVPEPIVDPTARPSTTLEPRPEEERPDTEGDQRVGDIDDLPRPGWK